MIRFSTILKRNGHFPLFNKRFSSGDLSDERGKQARGAMRQYLKNVTELGSNTQNDGIWARLRKATESPKSTVKRADTDQNQLSDKTTHQKPIVVHEVPSEDQPRQKRAINPRIGANQKKLRSMGNGEKAPASEGARHRDYKASEPRTQSKRKNVRTKNPAIQAVLHDHDYFAEKSKAGQAFIDENGMDPVDKLIARAFVNSFKTSSKTFQIYLENPNMRKVHVPQARSLRQLQYAMQPPIISEGNAAGNALATEAWGVIQKNIYYDDIQKRHLCSAIACGVSAVDSYLLSANDEDDVFEPTFRRGLDGLEEEYKEKLLQDIEPEIDDDSGMGETNWDVEAVEDEDQLS